MQQATAPALPTADDVYNAATAKAAEMVKEANEAMEARLISRLENMFLRFQGQGSLAQDAPHGHASASTSSSAEADIDTVPAAAVFRTASDLGSTVTRLLNRHTLQHYEGDKNKNQGKDWLRSVKQHFASHLESYMTGPLVEKKKILFATGLLRDRALSWWHHVCSDPENLPYASFAEFEAAFLAQFQPYHSDFAARKALDGLTQKGSVLTYSDKFMQLRNQISNMGEADALFAYVRGLKPFIGQWLTTQGVQTLPEAMALAQKIEITGQLYGRDTRPAAPDRRKDERHDGPSPMELNMAGVTKSGREGRSQTPGPSRSGSRSATPGNGRSGAGLGRTRLTPEEREYLRNNNGCFYCRKANAGHYSSECPEKHNK